MSNFELRNVRRAVLAAVVIEIGASACSITVESEPAVSPRAIELPQVECPDAEMQLAGSETICTPLALPFEDGSLPLNAPQLAYSVFPDGHASLGAFEWLSSNYSQATGEMQSDFAERGRVEISCTDGVLTFSPPEQLTTLNEFMLSQNFSELTASDPDGEICKDGIVAVGEM